MHIYAPNLFLKSRNFDGRSSTNVSVLKFLNCNEKRKYEIDPPFKLTCVSSSASSFLCSPENGHASFPPSPWQDPRFRRPLPSLFSSPRHLRRRRFSGYGGPFFPIPSQHRQALTHCAQGGPATPKNNCWTTRFFFKKNPCPVPHLETFMFGILLQPCTDSPKDRNSTDLSASLLLPLPPTTINPPPSTTAQPCRPLPTSMDGRAVHPDPPFPLVSNISEEFR